MNMNGYRPNNSSDDNETLRKATEEGEEEDISGDDEPWFHYKAELERSFEEEPVMVNRIASGHSEPSSENPETAPLGLGKAFLTVYVHNQPSWIQEVTWLFSLSA